MREKVGFLSGLFIICEMYYFTSYAQYRSGGASRGPTLYCIPGREVWCGGGGAGMVRAVVCAVVGVGRGSWIVGRGSFVVGRASTIWGSWVVSLWVVDLNLAQVVAC